MEFCHGSHFLSVLSLPALDTQSYYSYTYSMKTAISLPDELFVVADQFAQAQGISRSELYASALREYIDNHAKADLIERINRACEQIETSLPQQCCRHNAQKTIGNRMVALRRGQIWWADLGEPQGSQPGYRRPVLIVQEDHFNQSRLATVIVLSLTSNLAFSRAARQCIHFQKRLRPK